MNPDDLSDEELKNELHRRLARVTMPDGEVLTVMGPEEDEHHLTALVATRHGQSRDLIAAVLANVTPHDT